MELTKQRSARCLSGNLLKLLAMVTMFIDHAGATLFYSQLWMRCVGRLAFPIFAFLIAEGYTHTKNYKTYVLRMGLCALLSELPFNLMFGTWRVPAYQNVLLTFLIALLLLRLMDLALQTAGRIGALMGAAAIPAGFFLGEWLRTDYGGWGVVTVMAFWCFNRLPFRRLWQLFAVAAINIFLLDSPALPLLFGSVVIRIPIQSIAVFAMLPIALYSGKRGRGGKPFQIAGYLFYPVHLLIFALLALLIY